jgi:hypothetical protein
MLAVVACFCGYVPEAHASLISDVAADFSPTNNPNGVWRYGWSTTLGSPFVLSPDPATREGIDTWRGNGPLPPEDGNPAEYHNGTVSPILLGGTALYEPGQFGLHPGPAGQYAVVRYTAPEAGLAAIASMFSGQDIFDTTTDVHVLFNGQPIFDGLVEGFGAGSEVGLSTQILLLPGDEIDFAVGFGSNENYSNDSTALAATITLGEVPEPSSLLLLGVGVAGLTGRGRWRRA